MNEKNSKQKADILVAEDEGIISLNIKKLLLENGYGIAGVARTGEEAVSLVYDKQPDLILMDIMLEGRLNGIQAAEKINSKFSIPIIYLTALNDDETLLNAYSAGLNGYIVKPYAEEKLLSSIEFALHSK